MPAAERGIFTARMLRSRLRLFLLFWAGVAVLYAAAWRGGFGQDFHGWLQLYYDDSFWDCINRRGSDIKSFYQVTQAQLWLWTFLFGTHALPWFLLFTGLHAFNGLLLYRLCSRVFGDFGLEGGNIVSLIGTVLFLVAPGMTEVVVWKACYHYLIGLQVLLWCLIWCRQYLINGNLRWVWLSLILFLLATGTLETWYLILPSVGLLAIVYRGAGIIASQRLRAVLILLCLPMLCLFIGHLMLYQATYGYWLPHNAYRTGNNESHLLVAAHAWGHEANLLFFGRFWPHAARNWFYTRISNTTADGLAAIVVLSIAVIAAIICFRKGSRSLRAIVWVCGLALGSLIIVLHYAPETLFRIYNDRYLYFTGAFQYMAVALLIPRRKRLFNVVSISLILINGTATAILVKQWRQGTKIFWGIQRNFRWNEAPAVLILNLPSTYNGVGIINAHKPSEFTEHLRIFYGLPNRGNVYDVAAYNMLHPWDGAHVQMLDSMRLRVTLNQWGSWWNFSGFGATDYETPFFAVRFTDPGHEYELTLKDSLPPGTVILYQQGEQWRVLNRASHGEQW